MAKLYMNFSDPLLEDGKLRVNVSCAVVGAPLVPALAFQMTFAGEPTPSAIVLEARNKALAEVNVYLPTGKLTAGDVVMFCAPS